MVFATDCRPLVSIFNFKKGIPPLIAGRLQRCAYALSMYDFEIKYRKGETMYEARKNTFRFSRK